MGTGLVIRSTLQMAQVDLGFNSALACDVHDECMHRPAIKRSDSRRVYAELEARLAAIPGVESVVRTSRTPLGRGPTNTLVIEQYVSPTGTNVAEVPSAVVSPGYLEGLGIQMVRGRGFRPQDDAMAPPVAVVSEAMARRYWGTIGCRGAGGMDTMVRRIPGCRSSVLRPTSKSPPLQRVLSRNCTGRGIKQGSPMASFIVRTAGNVSDLTATIGRVVRELRLEAADHAAHERERLHRSAVARAAYRRRCPRGVQRDRVSVGCARTLCGRGVCGSRTDEGSGDPNCARRSVDLASSG